MTPQERQLMAELFDRLATLENAPRDPDAEAMIREGFRRAPNAAYALVQTVLVQDEALKAANDRIQELRAAVARRSQPEQPRGFLDIDARQPVRPRRAARLGAARAAGRRADARQPPRWARRPGYGGDPWARGHGLSAGLCQQGAPMQPPRRRSRVAAAARSSAPRRRPRPA